MFENIHKQNQTLSNPRHHHMVTRSVNNYFTAHENKFKDAQLTSPKEIKNVLKKLKNKKATGFDQINNRIIKNLSHRAIIHFKILINHILIFGHFPQTWKQA